MFVDAGVREVLLASRGSNLAFGRSVDEVRADVAARTQRQTAGPAVAQVRTMTIRGRTGTIPVRIYEPADSTGVVLAFHGGGWVSGDLDLLDATSRHLAAVSGQAVVNVGYRLAPEAPFPAAFEDACDALAFFDCPNEVWSEPKLLALYGESAGGNLAAAAALAAPDLGVKHLVHQALVYPVLDVSASGGSVDRYGTDHLLTEKDLEYFRRAYVGEGAVQPTDWRLSPLHAVVDGRVAPALLVSAGLDPVTDQADAYAALLAASGVAVTRVTFEGVPHLFFAMRGLTPVAAMAQDLVAHALRRALTRNHEEGER